MNKYPEVITQVTIEKNEYISDDEIQQDITDTKNEIILLEKEVEGLGLVAKATTGTLDGRMNSFRYEAKLLGLNERRDFVQFLEKLLEARQPELYENKDEEQLAKIGFFYLQWITKGGSVVDVSIAAPLVAKYFGVKLDKVMTGCSWKSDEAKV